MANKRVIVITALLGEHDRKLRLRAIVDIFPFIFMQGFVKLCSEGFHEQFLYRVSARSILHPSRSGCIGTFVRNFIVSFKLVFWQLPCRLLFSSIC